MEPDNPSRLFSRYQRLIEISRELSSTLELESLLMKVTVAATQISRADQATLYLWDESKQFLYLEASSTHELNRFKGTVLPADEQTANLILTTASQILYPVPETCKSLCEIEQRAGLVIRALVFVPIIAKERLLGVLLVSNKQNGEFNAYDQETLQALGAQAAIAIENARLFLQSDLIAELVHELRTPLASISTIAHLLQRPEVPDLEKQSMVQTLFKETGRLNDLATQYLDLARMEARRAAFELVRVDVHEVIRECHRIIEYRAAEQGISCRLNLTASLHFIEADKEKIKQALLNLLSNAIKYNKPGGSIRVSTTIRWEDLIVSIEDTGVGIAKTEIPFLFQRFYRSRTSDHEVQGTGLGLYISKQIIENHGGRIEVQSEPGVGSTITIHLPNSTK